MSDVLLFFAGMFVATALLEIIVLRRRQGRWGALACVASVALFSGVVWMGIVALSAHLRFGWKTASEPALDAADWVNVAGLDLIDVMLLSAVAFVPAASTAVTYRRLSEKVGRTS